MDQTPTLIGHDTQVNTDTSDSQFLPVVTPLKDGGFVVVWFKAVGYGQLGLGVYGQRYDSNGAPVGNEFHVNAGTSDTGNLPAITTLTDGGFVVTWSSWVFDMGVYGQRFDQFGAKVGGEFRVNETTLGQQVLSTTTALQDGGFLVTWSSWPFDMNNPAGQDGNGSGVFGRRYAADGTALTSEFQVNTTTAGHQFYSSSAVLQDGGFVVTWASAPFGSAAGQDGSGGGVFGQRYAADGTSLGGEFQINTYTAGDQMHPSVTALTNGGFVVTWMSNGQDGGGAGVFGQCYATNGSPVGSEFQVNGFVAGDQSFPSVTALQNGDFLVTWSSQNQDGDSWGVYGQRFAPDGAALGNEFRVNEMTAGMQLADSSNCNDMLATLADGRVVQVWAGQGTEEVFFRLINVDRTAPTATISAIDPSIAPLGASLRYGVVFSEAVTGVDAAVFSLSGSNAAATIVDVQQGVDAAHYVVTVDSGVGTGTVQLDLTGGAIADLAGNGLAGGAFLPDAQSAVGSRPMNVALGDINNDGHLDAVVQNYTGNNASVLLGNGDGTFAPQSTVPLGSLPVSVTLGDVNADGNLDMLVPYNYGNYVSILLGDGTGAFAAPSSYATGAAPYSAALGDFDGDNDLDLVVANNYGASVSFYFNAGDGSFSQQTYAAVGNHPAVAALADVNNDGFVDILTPDAPDGAVSILLGLGNGSFRPRVIVAVGDWPTDIAFGDVNGDGALDFVTSNFNGNDVSILLGDGLGGFAAGLQASVGPGPLSVELADLDGDGALDIVTSNFTGASVSVLLGNGDGTFAPQTTASVGADPRYLAVGDLNNDNRPDIVVPNDGSNSVSVLLNTPNVQAGPAYTIVPPPSGGAPVLTAASDSGAADNLTKIAAPSFAVALDATAIVGDTVELWLDGAPLSHPASHVIDAADVAAGFVTLTVTAGDLGADGVKNISAHFSDPLGQSTTSAALAVTLDTRLPTATMPAPFPDVVATGTTLHYAVVFSENVSGVDVGDFVLSGANADAAITGVQQGFDAAHYVVTVDPGASAGAVQLALAGAGIVDAAGNFFYTGGGVFASAATMGAGDHPRGVSVGDLNGDGRNDIVAANAYSNDLSIYTGNADGSFAAQPNLATGSWPHAVAIADVDDDGDLDLAVPSYNDSNIEIFLNDGSGGFTQTWSGAVDKGPIDLTFADLNGDSILDIATANQAAASVSILLGVGDGTFGAASTLAVGGLPTTVSAADLNEDGNVDLVAANENDDTLSILLGHGDGTFDAQATVATGDTPVAAATGDFNGDGHVDIAAPNWGDATVSILLGAGDGTFAAQTPLSVGSWPSAIAIADVNSDGNDDIAVTNSNGNSVSLLPGNGDGTFAPQTYLGVGSYPYSVAIGDLSGDGLNDILVANLYEASLSLLRNMPTPQIGPTITVIDPPGGDAPELTPASDTGALDGVTSVIAPSFTVSIDPTVLVGDSVELLLDGVSFAHPVIRIVDAADVAAGFVTLDVAAGDLGADGVKNISAHFSDPRGPATTSAALAATLDRQAPSGWAFALANSNFDGPVALAASTVLGTVTATDDPLSPSFEYFFAADADGTGAAQSMNGLTINRASGQISVGPVAINLSSSTWLIARDGAGNDVAKEFTLGFGTAAANKLAVAGATTASFALGGNDTLTGTVGADAMSGGAGADSFIGFVGADSLSGGAGKDTIQLAATSADLNAARNAQIVGVEAVSAASAASGVSIDLHMQSEGFSITAGKFADTIRGGAGADTINAGAGDDVFVGFIGADSLTGGAGRDTIVLAATSDDLNMANARQITGIEAVSAAGAAAGARIALGGQTEGFAITGSDHNDLLIGGNGADNIVAGGGDDMIGEFLGADTVDGGAGADTIMLSMTSTRLNAAKDAQIVGVETIKASLMASSKFTIDLHNQTEGFTISGAKFADKIKGSAGADVIDGLLGADSLTGGAGDDVFVYTNRMGSSLVTGVDSITDFTAGDRFSIGHTVAATDFHVVARAGTGSLAVDLAGALDIGNFAALGATLVTISSGRNAGLYVAINDGVAGFDATSDAVVKVQTGAAITAASFIV